jgi:hypothetical protein
MPRIRTIKPELPQSQTIGRLSRDARLLFIQLFTVADDAGRARAASRLLASLLYPYDDDAPGLIDTWLAELEHHKQVRRYEVDGSEYLEIVKWLEHQKIDRPSPSRLPEYREGSLPPREHSRASDADLGPSTCTKDLGPHTAAGAEAPPSVCDFFEEFWKEYPQRDGDNPKTPAKMKFDSLVKTGVDPQLMIAGARKFATKSREQGQERTRFIPHALKWLSEQRWADIAAVAYVATERAAEPAAQDWDAAVKRWLGNESHWPRWAGNAPGATTCRCPAEILIANGLDPESGRPIEKLVPIIAGTEEMAALVEFRQGIRLRPPRVFEVENEGRTQTLCWAETRWPRTYNDFGEKLPPVSEGEERVA